MAVGNHIEVAPATRLAIELRTLVDQLQACKSKTAELYGCLSEAGTDWANIGPLLAVSPDDAQAIVGLLLGVKLLFDGVQGYGGVDLNYFLNRLS